LLRLRHRNDGGGKRISRLDTSCAMRLGCFQIGQQ